MGCPLLAPPNAKQTSSQTQLRVSHALLKPSPPGLHPKGPTKLGAGSSSGSQLGPEPCQAGLPRGMLQPRFTNAATLAGCTFNQCRLFTELNNGGGGRPHPWLALKSCRGDVQRGLLDPHPTPPHPVPGYENPLLRERWWPRGGGGGPSLFKALGRQKRLEPALQYHFPQRPPADSGKKRGGEATFHPQDRLPRP